MLPANHRSQSGVLSLLHSMLQRMQKWVRQEIVDDDPWDKESLFSDSQASTPEQADPSPDRPSSDD